MSKWTLDKVTEIASKYTVKKNFHLNANGAYKWAKKNNCLNQVCSHMNPTVRYDLSKVQDIASNYNNRTEFCRESGGAYAWAVKNNKLDEICAHMEKRIKKKSKWNIDIVRNIALKHNNKKEFMSNASGAYKWAWKNNCLEEICAHMSPPPKPKSKYDLNKVQKLASIYTTRNSFRKNQGGAYDWARRNNHLDLVCTHMKPLIRYNLKKVKIIASKFDSRVEFLDSDEGAYKWAWRNNILDEVCSHMNYLRTYWNVDSVGNEALKYDSRKEFQKHSAGAYEWALRNNCIDSVCSHMEVKGHKYKRALYVYEFENNSAYIGLTYDYHKRDLEHKRRGPVFEELKKSNYNLIKCDNWMSASKARKEEKELIEKYKIAGWNILNTATAGSLGGNDIIWSDEKLIAETKKYKTVNEFRKKNPSAYSTAHQKGFGKYASHLKYERTTWNLEKVTIEANKYKARTDFMRLSPGAYDWCRKNNELEKVCSHMQSKRTIFTLDVIKEIALQYDSMSAFQNNRRAAFEWTRKHDFFNEICGHMKPMRKSWDFEKVITEVSKYNSRTEFQRQSGSAYMWAQRNKLLEVVYKHLKKSL